MQSTVCLESNRKPIDDYPNRAGHSNGTLPWCPATGPQMCNPPRLAFWEASFQSPFILLESASPALHLFRASDIERNPNPSCAGCLKTIRYDFHPVFCTTCQRVFHRNSSSLTRYRKRSISFVCCFCSVSLQLAHVQSPHSPNLPSNTNHSTPFQRTWTVRNTKIRANTTPTRFDKCTNMAHHSCTGLSRYSTDVTWSCHTCKLQPTTQYSITPQISSSSRPANIVCPECKGKLTSSRFPLTCSACDRGFHVECAPETRTVLDRLHRLRKSKSWGPVEPV